MQPADSNLVIYGPSGAVWAWGTDGQGGASAVMQGDGNFVVQRGSTVLRHTGTGGRNGAFVRMQDDDNLVVYLGSTAVWSRKAVQGPLGIPNAAIADRAETRANGAYGNQCLIFVASMIDEAGGPFYSFPGSTNTYQTRWSQIATQVPSLADARRGDVIQWGGGDGGTLDPHTAIVTSPGADPGLIDSNFGNKDERVRRGSFSSRNGAGVHFRIWRVGQV